MLVTTFARKLIFVLILSVLSGYCFAQEEFKVKREEVFEFAVEPKISKIENNFEISFEVKSNCDVTIAIEDSEGKIVRHLISGVLGGNAPAPFQKNSLKQKIIWDGKNDQENYLDNLENYKVRVSLGLKPQFEKTLYWSPWRRVEKRRPLLAPTPEGMVVYEGGQAMDFVKLYHHDGNYNKALYPFPADKIKNTKGLIWHTFPQDGKSSPIKNNFLQNTMLTSGDNAVKSTYIEEKKAFESIGNKHPQHYGMSGTAATTVACYKNKIALAFRKVNRLSLEGDTAGLPLTGPTTSLVAQDRTMGGETPKIEVGPTSSAFSPDGEWLYMTGYTWSIFMQNGGYWQEWLNCVTRTKFDGSGKLEIIIGSDKLEDYGKDNNKLSVPTCVRTDSKGNLYVTDYMNDRIQVYTLEGKWIRSINITKPVNLTIDEKNNEFYVCSWFIKSTLKTEFSVKKPVLLKFKDIENPVQIQSYELPFNDYNGSFSIYDSASGFQYNAVVDIYGSQPSLWVISSAPRPFIPNENVNQMPWSKDGIKVYSIAADKLNLEKDFGKEVSKDLARLTPPLYYRQKLYVNPKTELLYLWEGQNEDGTGAGKGSQELVEFNPKTGESKLIPLPFDAEDITFDTNGMIYLKSRGVVARFQMDGMKEIPWDYGSEEFRVGFASGRMGKQKDLVSGLLIPGNLNWQHGGMFMTAKGELVVASYFATGDASELVKKQKGNDYKPTIYPGRATSHSHGGTYINVWDKHGKVLITDAVPGLAELDGIGMDATGGLYMMTHATRIYEDKSYYNDLSGTLLKFSKGKGRILTMGGKNIPVELKNSEAPKRSVDLKGTTGSAWVEDGDWMYGGVGYGGKNRGVGCACWTSRYTLDYFARSFAPELDRYKVAVLDANGNLILRIGQYGNIEDGKPTDLAGGPKNPRSIGGDEVALFHGAYLATLSDKYLYIADPGNLRILKVKLGYNTEKIISLSK